MRKNNFVVGVTILGLGILALLNSLDIINFHISLWRFWPLFILIPGITFELSYFNGENTNRGLLMPGGILTTHGIIFMICSFLGYGHMIYLWPWFLGGVGLGFLQMFFFGRRDKALFWLGFSFTAFAVLASSIALLSLKGTIVFPVILIAVGAILLHQSKEKDKPIFKFEYEKEEE